MAERVGFEPTIQFPVYGTSNAAPSAARPPLHVLTRPPRARQDGPFSRGLLEPAFRSNMPDIQYRFPARSTSIKGGRYSIPPVRIAYHRRRQKSLQPSVLIPESSFSLKFLKNSCSNARLSSS